MISRKILDALKKSDRYFSDNISDGFVVGAIRENESSYLFEYIPENGSDFEIDTPVIEVPKSVGNARALWFNNSEQRKEIMKSKLIEM